MYTLSINTQHTKHGQHSSQGSFINEKKNFWVILLFQQSSLFYLHFQMLSTFTSKRIEYYIYLRHEKVSEWKISKWLDWSGIACILSVKTKLYKLWRSGKNSISALKSIQVFSFRFVNRKCSSLSNPHCNSVVCASLVRMTDSFRSLGFLKEMIHFTKASS